MGMKEELISELGFLDEANVVMDERPSKRKGNRGFSLNKEVPDVSVEQVLLESVEGLSDDAALAVMDAYRKIPKEVKKAVEGVYKVLRRLGGKTSIEDIRNALKTLKEACGGEYKGIYDTAVKDAKKYVPKIQARLFAESIT